MEVGHACRSFSSDKPLYLPNSLRSRMSEGLYDNALLTTKEYNSTNVPHRLKDPLPTAWKIMTLSPSGLSCNFVDNLHRYFTKLLCPWSWSCFSEGSIHEASLFMANYHCQNRFLKKTVKYRTYLRYRYKTLRWYCIMIARSDGNNHGLNLIIWFSNIA